MARKDAKTIEAATLGDVIRLGREVEAFTADPLDPAEYLNSGASTEVQRFRALLATLITTIVNIPRRADTEKDRTSRAEAETLRTACELFEIACDQGSSTAPEAVLEIRKAMAILDAALVRFAVIAS